MIERVKGGGGAAALAWGKLDSRYAPIYWGRKCVVVIARPPDARERHTAA